MERPSFNRSQYYPFSHRPDIKKEIVDCPHPKWLRWWIIRTAIYNPHYNPTQLSHPDS